MQVNFKSYNPNFTSSALKNPTEVAKYLTILAKRKPLKDSDILDLTETITKTKETGIIIAIKSLENGARELGFIK